MQVPLKHHYVPVFYLSRWVGKGGRLCQFSRPHENVMPKRCHPAQTGFSERLYEMPGLPPDRAQQIEQRFMQPVDTMAAEALEMLETGDPRIHQEARLRSAWSRFLMSLMMRVPESIAALKGGVDKEWICRIPGLEARYAVEKGPDDPPTFQEYLDQRGPDEFERWTMVLASRLMDHVGIGGLLNNMRWRVRTIAEADGEFLTSDRPVVMTTTLTEESAYVIMPIGPQHLFVAARDPETQRRVMDQDPADQVKALNTLVVSRAVKFAYARDDRQLAFIQQHFGTKPRASLLERLVAHQAKRRQ
ncbi:DUF4238 domain-containing protein [Azospirillum thiophilum]|uniref:DUF4238 domain-containing protein n=1 Tax=Azospirillum thiophilum TaxID=528244 RepID=UPI0013147F8F|nr:DUF4238 domain-containing protein [Azospirillum thiophilum]